MLIRSIAVSLLAMSVTVFGRTWYVNGMNYSEDHSGVSWPAAFRSLSQGLDSANCYMGDTVKVMGGTGYVYKPVIDTLNPKNSTFYLSNGTILLGGYTYSASTGREERNVSRDSTILSGAVNDSDTCYHVVKMQPGSRLDGFIVQDGKADGGNRNESGRGGGVLAYASGTVIKNCLLRNNRAEFGGAIGLLGIGMVVESTTVAHNYSTGGGGGLFLEASDNVILSSCQIFDNRSNQGPGGAICMYGNRLNVYRSTISNNYCREYGGAMYLRVRNAGLCTTVLDSNSAGDRKGGAIYVECDTFELYGFCSLSYNRADAGYGGAVCFLGKSLDISNSSFTGNSADAGGALYVYNDNGFSYAPCAGVSMYRAFFTNNTSVYGGGAIALLGKGAIENSYFTGNTSSNGNGGAVCGWVHRVNDYVHFRTGMGTSSSDTSNYYINPPLQKSEIDSLHAFTFLKCSFSGNRAKRGSAVDYFNGSLTGCLFDGNHAETGWTVHGMDTMPANSYGNGNDSLSLLNCTFVNNTAPAGFQAGVVYCRGAITNSIFWNDTGKEIDSATCSVPSYSIVRGWTGGGTGTSAADPLLSMTYRPDSASPAIDAGDPSTDTTGWGKDLAGNARIYNGRIDMGAFEYLPAPDSPYIRCAIPMLVEQVEGSGNLWFRTRISGFAPGERPVSVKLVWEGGWPRDMGEQVIPITESNYSIVPEGNGITYVDFSIPREQIRDRILSRTRSFDRDVRYINAELNTRTDACLWYRCGTWSYPKLSSGHLLFAPQIFAKPAAPAVSTPAVSERDATFKITNKTPGIGEEAVVRFSRTDGGTHDVDTVFPMYNTSGTGEIDVVQAAKWIVRKLDWNYSYATVTDGTGRRLLSGFARSGAILTKSGAFYFPDTADPGSSALGRVFTAWKMKIPETSEYTAWVYVNRPPAAAARVFLTFGERPIEEFYFVPPKFFVDIPKNGVPGWYPIRVSGADYDPNCIVGFPVLDSGVTTVNVHCPTRDIGLAAVALYPGRNTGLKPGDKWASRAPDAGTENTIVTASGFNLRPDAEYRMSVFVRDRYGNAGDTVTLAGIRTVGDYFKGKAVVHQDTASGDLVFTVKPDTVMQNDSVFVEGLTFSFGGRDTLVPTHIKLARNGPTEIRLPRAALPASLLADPAFSRHALYSPAKLNLSLHHFAIRAKSFNGTTDDCAECEYIRDSIIGGRGVYDCNPGFSISFWGWNFVFRPAKCSYTRYDTVPAVTAFAPIPVLWPDTASRLVASQEYRPVTTPEVRVLSLKAQKAVLSCTNLNTLPGGGGRKEQMAGELRIKWRPGSACEDSTKDTLPFINTFTMQGGRIAFTPSFEGSARAAVGQWRPGAAAGSGGRHQWLDLYRDGETLLGGGFYPDLGDSVTYAQITGDRSLLPALSTRIHLKAGETSANDSTQSEKFTLWALAPPGNDIGNRYFYYGIDGVPVTSQTGDAYNIGSDTAWLKGPAVSITEAGYHTVDLYMRDDGVRLLGVALSKDTAAPALAAHNLSRWGDAGFDLTCVADKLSPGTKTTFSWTALDRYGNVAARDSLTLTPPSSVKRIPNVVITPDAAIENGYYPSLQPSFTMSLDAAYAPDSLADTLALAATLYKNTGGSRIELSPLVIAKQDSQNVWNVSVSSPLDEFPSSGGVSATNGYELVANVHTIDTQQGAWTKLIFGAIADTAGPQGVTVLDPIYEIPPHLRFRFDHGLQMADSTIVGDLEVLFDMENRGYPDQKLFLEGARIRTFRHTDTSGIVHDSIDTIFGGTFGCYNCVGEDVYCSRKPLFEFPYGRFKAEAEASKITLRDYGAGGTKLAAEGLLLLDDKGNPSLMSAAKLGTPVAVPVTRLGIVDPMYGTRDCFYFSNVLKFGEAAGFSLEGCFIQFFRGSAGSGADTFTIVASGYSEAQGPKLDFSVISPKYLSPEFSAFDELSKPQVLRYTALDRDYTVVFDTSNKNSVPLSDIRNARYVGWDLGITSYDFTPDGVRLTGFSVKLDDETFPPDVNPGGAAIGGMSGILITGDPSEDRGALHFSKTYPGVKNGASSLRFTTGNNYVFTGASAYTFAPHAGGPDFAVRPTGGLLLLPSWQNRTLKPNPGVPDTIHAGVSALRFGPRGIDTLEALGKLDHHIGLLSLYGNIRVWYAAHDFQLDVKKAGDTALFTITRKDSVLFRDGATDTLIGSIPVTGASIGLFSDFSINTLYGKQLFDGGVNWRAAPGQFPSMRFPGKGIDVVRTDDTLTTGGIRFWLLAPEIEFGSVIEGVSPASAPPAEIYNVGFDADGNMVNLSGGVPFPDALSNAIGRSPLGVIGDSIASLKVNELYFGFDRGNLKKKIPPGGKYVYDKLTVGADAVFTFGSKFRVIGLNGKKISIERATVSRTVDPSQNKNWKLDELRATSGPLPMRFGIGPRAWNDNAGDEDYVDFYNGGNGIVAEYSDSAEALRCRLQGWNITLTDTFPVRKMRGISFAVDTLEYTKRLDNTDKFGRISKLKGSLTYEYPDTLLGLSFFSLKRSAANPIRISLATDTVTSDTNADTANNTGCNAYFDVTFDSLKIGDSCYSVACGAKPAELRVYFSGKFSFTGCLTFKDTIPIYPLFSKNSAEWKIMAVPPDTGVSVPFNVDASGIYMCVNFGIVSRDSIPVINERLNAAAAIGFRFTEKGFDIDSFKTTWRFPAGKKFFDAGFLQMGVDSVGIECKNHAFAMKFHPWISTTLGDSGAGCTIDAKPAATMKIDIAKDSGKALSFTWSDFENSRISCRLLDFGFKLEKFTITDDTIGFKTGFLDLKVLKTAGILDADIEPCGIDFANVYVVKDAGTWKRYDGIKISANFGSNFAFDILGCKVSGTLGLGKILSDTPSIGISRLKIVLSKNLGSTEICSPMGLIIKGKAPYLEPDPSQPMVLKVRIPSFKLTEQIKMGDALMEMGMNDTAAIPPPKATYKTWYFRGSASMNVPGFADNMAVDLSLEKPHPWENITGIRHAKLTIKLSTGSRIPLGTTGFYITGFMGALYDGYGMPEGATACDIPQLPPGLKLEAAVFVEFERPEVATGKLGVWIQLTKLNFGVNGEVVALSGIADAQACAAIYNNGTAFHGKFAITVNKALTMQGKFLVDIWTDNSGGNFTAEASARVGLQRGSLIDKRWLKVPGGTTWFSELATRLGKFSDNSNGLTTGIRFFGKSWGVGMIGGSFKVGNVDQYKLKQSPLGAPPPRGAPSGLVFLPTGLILTGGEIISVAAASGPKLNEKPYVWPEHALRIGCPAGTSDTVADANDANYLPIDGNSKFYEKLNTAGRMWVNNGNHATVFVAAPAIDSVPEFQYMIFAGLKPPLDSVGMAYNPVSNQVVFNGHIDNFQKDIRCIVRRDSSGAPLDTLLKQRMLPKFYYAMAEPDKSDTAVTATPKMLYSFVEIPPEQFAGFDPAADTTLLDLDTTVVRYDAGTRRLTFTNLTWDAFKGRPGACFVAYATTTCDFAIEDGGVKQILPDSAIDRAMTVRPNPKILDTVVVRIPNTRALEKIRGLTAASSPVASNWTGKDERRSIFLRWNRDDNPALFGYEIKWHRSGNPAAGRSAIVGPVDNYTITVPDMDSGYTQNCDSANKGSYYVSCDTTIGQSDIDYYNGATFNVVVTPVTGRLEVDYKTHEARPARFGPDTILKVEADAALGDTVTNITLGATMPGSDNRFSIGFYNADTLLSPLQPIAVPLNQSAMLRAEVAVSSLDTAGVKPSEYGELYGRIGSFAGYPVGDTAIARFSIGMPGLGAAKTMFTIGSSLVVSDLSITPSPRDYRCADLFALGCKRILPKRNGGFDTVNICFPDSCSSCAKPVDTLNDPNRYDNNLPKFDPCSGRGQDTVRRRSPFGTYTAYLYAINNGHRATPAADDGSGAPVVYDSLSFTVTPPKPLIHNVKPNYILDGRNDTMRLQASDLWKADSGDPMRPVISIDTGNGSVTVYPISYIPVPDGAKKSDDAEILTNAEYELRFICPGFGNKKRVILYVENRDLVWGAGDTVRTRSEGVGVDYIGNPEVLECDTAKLYPEDSLNSNYIVECVGIYPDTIRIDTLNPGRNDTVIFYFSRLWDMKKSNYFVLAIWNSDTILINNFSVKEYGVEFKAPDFVKFGQQWKFTLKYYNSISGCDNKQWGVNYAPPIVHKASYSIVSVDTGVKLILANGQTGSVHLDNFHYFLGLDPVTWPTQPDSLYTLGSVIPMSYSDWATFIITDKNDKNKEYLYKWIDVNARIHPEYLDGTPFASGDTVTPGTVIRIPPIGPKVPKLTDPKIYYCCSFSGGQKMCNVNRLEFDALSKSPLTIELWYERRDTNNIAVRVPGDTFVYNFHLELPSSIEPIVIPSANLLQTGGARLWNYPLLLRLDTTVVKNWTSAQNDGFYFCNSTLKPLPFQVEKVDWTGRTMEAWVGVDTMDPGIGNNTICFVTGAPGTLPPARVWQHYGAVWHGSFGDTLADATGRGYSVPVTGFCSPMAGVIGSGDSIAGSGTAQLSGTVPFSTRDNGVTLSAWIKIGSMAGINTAGSRLFSAAGASGAPTLDFSVMPDAGLRFIVDNDTLRSISGAVEAGAWLNVAATYSWFGTGSGMGRIFVNGVPVAEKPLNNGAVPGFGTTGSLRLAGSGAAPFPGLIDELRVSPLALSAQWLRLDYYSQRRRNDFLRPPVGVSSIASISRPGCRLVPDAKDGDRVTADRSDIAIEGVPARYLGRTWLLLPFAWRQSSGDTLFTVTTSGAVRAAVLVDSALASPPAFLDDYTRTNIRATVKDNSAGLSYRFLCYEKEFTGPQTISFGGQGTGSLPYAVLLDLAKERGEVRVTALGAQGAKVITRASSGGLLFNDREYEIDSIAPALAGGVLVQTPNAFKHDGSGSYLTLSVDRKANVHLLLDSASVPGTSLVDSSWIPEGVLLRGNMGAMNAYKTVSDGSMTIPGPRAGGGSGNRFSYGLVVKEYKESDTTADTGITLYSDTTWRIISLPGMLAGAEIKKTRQAEYASEATDAFSFRVSKSGWVYCAIDSIQTIPPSFIGEHDPVFGSWERVTNPTLMTNAPALYKLYRRFFASGTYSFAGARSGGETANRFNYAFFVKPRDSVIPPDPYPDPYFVSPVPVIGPVLPGTIVFPDISVCITKLPPELVNLHALVFPSHVDSCEYVVLKTRRPIRVHLGIDPAYDPQNTFLTRDNWTQTSSTISFCKLVPDFRVWHKDYAPSDSIAIPNLWCDRPTWKGYNYVMFIEFLEYPKSGFRAYNLTVRGIGERRTTASDHFSMNNLDVSYAWAMGLGSRSWRMNVNMHGGRSDPKDTTAVLSPFIDTVVAILDSVVKYDSSYFNVGGTFPLVDLMPTFLDADSVLVSATDLTTSGFVRVVFTNKSDRDIDRDFAVVLFEDNNGDFQYTNPQDHFLGRAFVRGIRAHEHKIFEIPVYTPIAFPKRTLFAFIDAENWVEEINEFNNVASSGTVCDGYARPVYTVTWDGTSDTALLSIIPPYAQVVPCRLRDNNRDSIVDERDTLCLVYAADNKLHGINAVSHDSLWTSFYYNGSGNASLTIEDFNGDGKPEIVVNSAMYSNSGTLVWDATSIDSVSSLTGVWDFNRDGDADSVAAIDSCVTIWSGRDTSLVYVYPLASWPGLVNGATVGVLADIPQGLASCYDVSASYPRIVAGLDSATVTIRVANAGAAQLKFGIGISVYHIAADSSVTLSGTAAIPNTLNSAMYQDVTLRIAVPAGGFHKLRFVVDTGNRYFEADEVNNRLEWLIGP